jgi:thiamine transport system permease protein
MRSPRTAIAGSRSGLTSSFTSPGSRFGTTSWRLLLATPPLVFVLLFFVYPVVSILARGLAPEGTFDLAGMLDVLTRPFVLEVAWFTLWQAAVSTALTVLIALPGAYVFARFDFPGRKFLNAVALVPFVLPTVVVAAAFLALVGARSPIGVRLDHTIWAILIAHVFYNYAVVLRIVGGVWAQLDPRLEDAARVLGASRWHAFRRVTLPLLKPAIASAASIVFLFTFTSFGVVLILGGPTFATIEVEIYRQAAQLLDLRVASTLALLQLVALGGLLLAYTRLGARNAVRSAQQPTRQVLRRPRGFGERAAVGANLVVMAILLGLPLAVLVERSLALGGGGYGLDYYASLFDTTRSTALFVPAIDALRYSLVFAAIATSISVFLGLLASQVIASGRGVLASAFDALLTLPLGTSAVIVGFGMLISLGSLPVDLRTSALLIPIAHAIVALPFVVRAVVPVMRSIDRRLHEAAAVLGASPRRTWRLIDLPIVARACLVGAAFSFAVSLGEFGATLFIVRPETPTMPIAIFRLLGQPGALAFGQAMAMATLLMVVTAAAALLIDRFRLSSASAI